MDFAKLKAHIESTLEDTICEAYCFDATNTGLTNGYFNAMERCGIIQNWISTNLNSANAEVRSEAERLDPLYGTTGNGQLSFANDIANESVVGGTESGTYVSIHNDAALAVGDIELLDAEFPDATISAQSLPTPAQDYGSLAWVPFVDSDGSVGYWAPKGDGTFYYFGANGELYDDAYEGAVKTQDTGANLVGNVSTYDFATNDPGASTMPSGSIGYGGVYFA